MGCAPSVHGGARVQPGVVQGKQGGTEVKDMDMQAGATEKKISTQAAPLEEEVAVQGGAVEKEVSTQAGAGEKDATVQGGAVEKEGAVQGGAVEKEVSTQGGAVETEVGTQAGAVEKEVSLQAYTAADGFPASPVSQPFKDCLESGALVELEQRGISYIMEQTPPVSPSKGAPACLGTGPSLQEICANSGAVFAVLWKLKDGSLQAADHYNPEDRIEKVRKETSLGDLYTTESYKFQMTPGIGIVGKVYVNRNLEFYEDVSQLAADVYIRIDIAKKYGIQSVAVMPFDGGVLEIGTDLEKEWGRSWAERFYGRIA